MTNLTTEQEQAIALFKERTHLPGNGFHALIIELGKEYQLPFQQVRTVFMDSQAAIEKRVRDDFEKVLDEHLTKDHWLSVIRNKLAELTADNPPLMDKLRCSKRYIKLQEALANPINSEEERGLILASLEDIYEFEVCNPLKAMLRTSSLFWAVKSELFEMTPDQRQKFSDYPQHMEATEHLLELASKLAIN